MILLKMLHDELFFWGQVRLVSGTLLDFPEFPQQIVSSGNKGVMRSDISFRRELIGWTCEYPSKHSFEGDWGTWWSSPPAMQQCFNEDVHTKKEINSPRSPKVWVCKRKTVKVFPVWTKWDWLDGQITSHARHNNSCKVELMTSPNRGYGQFCNRL